MLQNYNISLHKEESRTDFRGGSGEDGGGFGFSEADGNPVQAEFGGVPEIETRGTIPDQKVSERRSSRTAIVDGGGSENGVSRERNPIDV